MFMAVFVEILAIAALLDICAGAFMTGGSKWTYLSGSAQVGSPGNYSVVGNYSPDTLPIAMKQPAFAKDSRGNMWLFEPQSYRASVFSWNGKLWRLAYYAHNDSESGEYAGPYQRPSPRSKAVMWALRDSEGFLVFGGLGGASNAVHLRYGGSFWPESGRVRLLLVS